MTALDENTVVVIDGYLRFREIMISKRQTMGMTQRELAQRMGTVQSAISELENGMARSPSLDMMYRWTTALNITMTINLDFGPVLANGRNVRLVLGDSNPQHDRRANSRK